MPKIDPKIDTTPAETVEVTAPAPAYVPTPGSLVPVTRPTAPVPRDGTPRRRVSLGEELWCRAYIASRGNATEATRQVWPSTANPSARGSRLARRLRWRIRELADRAIGQYQPGADAVLTECASIAYRDDGTVSTADRLRALELLARLQGLDRGQVANAPAVAVQINLGPQDGQEGPAQARDGVADGGEGEGYP